MSRVPVIALGCFGPVLQVRVLPSHCAHRGGTDDSSRLLIPAFAMLWRAPFLSEAITALILAGCAVIVTGTALATHMITYCARAS